LAFWGRITRDAGDVGPPENPVLAFWGEMSAILGSPATAARRLNPYALPFLQSDAGLAGKRFLAAVVVQDGSSSSRTVNCALEAVRTTAAAIGQQSDF
jgi:hypothetical protein